MPPALTLREKRVLISLGPTREYLDPVRYISNASSGKMGLALARAFRARGARVRLVQGPGVEQDHGFPHQAVVSAREMRVTVRAAFKICDVFASCAAVSDFRPATRSVRKKHRGPGGWRVRLLPNPDILAEMGRRKGKRLLVGFALEDGQGLARARRKMREKNCDLVVLNSPEAMESERIHATLLSADGKVRALGRIPKETCAEEIVKEVERCLKKRSSN